MRPYFFAFLVAIPLIGQVKNVEQKSRDVFEELESENLTLRFFDAISGKEIPNADVTIQEIGQFVTDDEGKVLFPIPEEDMEYVVSFRKQGYIPTDFPIEIMAGTIFFNRFSISPNLDIKFVRIVVDWDQTPLDLDAHFVKLNGYHISYRNMRVLADGSGQLDRDAMNGNGPETITINEVSTLGKYEYYIHDYTNRSNPRSSELSRSKATVKVYGEGKLLKVLQVPRNAEGTVWRVFSIINGQVTAINQMSPK